MSSKKKVWRGRAVYERLLAERDREGWSLPELSRQSGVPESTLQRWHRRLKRERALAPRPFVEVLNIFTVSRNNDQVGHRPELIRLAESRNQCTEILARISA